MLPIADPYLQEDGRTLRNRLGIAGDPEALEAAIDTLSFARIAELEARRTLVAPTGDATELRGMHRAIFGDVFEWAGAFRNERPLIDGRVAEPVPTMRKGGSRVSFLAADRIDRELERLQGRLVRDDRLRGLGRPAFVRKGARLLGEINAIHPFREGNGRVQRLFVGRIAAEAGHPLDFSVVSRERMYHASEAWSLGDTAPMRRLVGEIADPARCARLKPAIAFFQRSGFDWNDRYLATTEPGQAYRGTLAGIAGDDFMMHDGQAILIGARRDLPDDARVGATLAFQAAPGKSAQKSTGKPARKPAGPSRTASARI